MLNFLLSLGAYEHNLLAYERDIRGSRFGTGCKFAPCTRVQIMHMNTAYVLSKTKKYHGLY